ncbi:hypothetical protein [Paraburkholderia aspalathi]|uniref:hypothetical protein n=1 Tax=Paraburkholderia aspalathi TaxID=1324617 RepID=UPI0038B763C1
MPQSESREPFRAFVNFLTDHLIVKLVILLAGLAGAVQLAATPFATPQIHVTGSDPHAPFVFPFALKNSSGMLPLGNVEWTCTVDHMEMMGNSTMDNVGVRTIGQESSIDADGVTNHVCNVLNAGAQVSKVTMDVTVQYTMLYFWHRRPVKQRFTWVSDGEHSAWIEGDIH